MSRHNLAFQMQTAIDSAFKTNMDKHSMKHTGESIHKVCSINEKKSLQEVAYQFKDFMKINNPDIKLIKDVDSSHWQAFLNEKAKTCSYATLKNYISRIYKLEVLSHNHFKIEIAWKNDITLPQSMKTPIKEKLRVQAMDIEDLKAALDFGYQNSKSISIYGIDLAYRFALRCQEVASLKVSDIDIEKNILHIKGKGGRHRFLPISSEDKVFLLSLIQNKTKDELVLGVKADSINMQLNRILKKLDLKHKIPFSSIHSIRKLRAQYLWDLKRNEGLSKIEAMKFLNLYLGHGNKSMRYDLLHIYVQNPW